MTRRNWTNEEKILLDLMLQDGRSIQHIARRLRRTMVSVYMQAKGRVDTLRNQPGTRVYSCEDIRRLFSVHKSVPGHWIAYGWLKTRRNKAHAARCGSKPQRPRHMITERNLFAFIELRESWVAWRPSQITDPDLRAYAEHVRLTADGEWLHTKHVAERFGYATGTVSEWVRRERIPGVRTVKYGSNYFFWSEDVALLTPPLERRYSL